MASFDFNPEESSEGVAALPITFELSHQILDLELVKKRIVDSRLQALESERLQQHSFLAIAEYLKEANEIDYQTFLTLREMAPKHSKQYFTAKIFMYLQPDKSGYISSEALIR